MTPADIRAELDRALRAGDDALAELLTEQLADMVEEAPDFARYDEVCSCGRPLEPSDTTTCEACRRDHEAG